MSRRLIVLVIVTVSILTACGRASSTSHPAAGGYRIFLESGFSNNAQTVKVVDLGTGTVERELPLGTPARNLNWNANASRGSNGNSIGRSKLSRRGPSIL